MSGETLRVGIVGPLLGHHPGWVISQGERLAERLRADDFEVLTTSGRIRRIPRAIDMARTMRSWRGRVDVVVVMVFSGPGFVMTDLASRSARSLGVPLVLWLHGGNLPAFARRHPRWVQRVLGRAEILVAPSRYLLDAAGLANPPARRRPVVISNVLPGDLPPFESRERLVRPGLRLLWMRTFHPLYRPDLAVEVLGRLLEHHPDACMTMAGQDQGRDHVERLAADRGLTDHIRFAGFLDGRGKALAFREHDVFLNTSAADNAPVSLIEAAANGLPIVSTAIGGIPELFPDGERALLAPDPAGLAEAVERLVADPSLAASLAASAHERARNCTWERVGPQWEELLRQVASRD